MTRTGSEGVGVKKSSVGSRRKARSKSKKPRVRSASSLDRRGAFAELTRLIREEIWPVERKVLFNPERFRYVRKLIRPEGCVFCKAVADGVKPESLLVYSGEFAIVVLNKYPYNSGHLLILPRRHCGEFLELSPDEHREMNACLQKSLAALQDAYRPSGFNVGLNLGSAAGAGIPEHLHYHVIPRWEGDTNFFPLIADTKVVVETLEQTHRRLVPYFDEN